MCVEAWFSQIPSHMLMDLNQVTYHNMYIHALFTKLHTYVINIAEIIIYFLQNKLQYQRIKFLLINNFHKMIGCCLAPFLMIVALVRQSDQVTSE